MRDTNTVLLDLETYGEMVIKLKENKEELQNLYVDLKNALLENKNLSEQFGHIEVENEHLRP